MPVELKTVEKSLRKKGFVEEERGKHCYFYHELNGKRTGFYTYVSRGTAFKTIDDSLLKSMKAQLGLDSSSEAKRLLECPMSGDDYVRFLQEKKCL